VVAPLVITLLPAALGGTALAVDAGFFYVQDQRVQVAADAAAMGVSKILASNPTTAQMQAAALQAVDDMTGGNMAGTIQTPISVTQTSTGVTVTVSSKSNDFFGGALGVVAPTLSTTAVVKQISSSSASGTSCVLALNTSSTAVEVSGGATVTLDSGGNCAAARWSPPASTRVAPSSTTGPPSRTRRAAPPPRCRTTARSPTPTSATPRCRPR
jgi:Flp pilus assembly protein TadG